MVNEAVKYSYGDMRPFFCLFRTNMYTETQLQQIIHRLYEGNVDYPDSTSDDYLLRRGYINDSANEWAYNSGNIMWRELFKNVSDSDGDDTTTTAIVYDMPSDYVFMASRLSIGGNFYTFSQPQEVANRQDRNETRFFWITGKPNAYQLNISEAVDAGGAIEYSYYKQPTLVTTTTDVLDMSRPYFAVYYTLARLYEQDLNTAMMSVYENKAKGILDEMLVANEIPPYMYGFSVPDTDWQTSGIAFGRS